MAADRSRYSRHGGRALAGSSALVERCLQADADLGAARMDGSALLAGAVGIRFARLEDRLARRGCRARGSRDARGSLELLCLLEAHALQVRLESRRREATDAPLRAVARLIALPRDLARGAGGRAAHRRSVGSAVGYRDAAGVRADLASRFCKSDRRIWQSLRSARASASFTHTLLWKRDKSNV